MIIEEKYMRRALQLAANALGSTSPNPMVGAVIVSPDGKVIGEGWHRVCGQGHAEVNAVASVADRDALRDSTMYVTLEPCSHYGKTPPCAKLIIDSRIPRVVVGAGDPNPKVAGRGIAMLREAGVEVVTGVLAEESRRLNCRFFTAHTLKRPFITLKWAQSADGFMDVKRDGDSAPFRFSTPLTTLSTMRLRALADAVVTTSATLEADHCRLTVRDWAGKSPRRVVFDRSGHLESPSHFIHTTPGYGFAPGDDPELRPLVYGRHDSADLAEIMSSLFRDHGVTSVLVEAGPSLLGRLLELSLWDALRVEVSPVVLGERGDKRAPALPVPPGRIVSDVVSEGGNRLITFSNNPLFM